MDRQQRKSISYSKLHQEPLHLTVLKLDGSFFDIEVAKTGTVGEVKRAVETAFLHLPKKGPGKVSWTHVWGQFCLCHERRMLLNDRDHIGMLGIKDGDQFIHHLSRTQSEREDLDSEGATSMDEHQDSTDDHRIEILEDNQEDDDDDDDVESNDGTTSNCGHRITHWLRGCFPYRKLKNTQTRIEERNTSSSRFSFNKLTSSKNVNDNYSLIETWKGK
ncbi:hypothetical protein ACJIZ3_001438 [Penstemon smallii]|uniref:SNRNP25 ubiquitin-like domain-containing protein n=1 Tax=Penstemon smallii TaxID=265156 RepID=A0ABD3U4X3_9LAMI